MDGIDSQIVVPTTPSSATGDSKPDILEDLLKHKDNRFLSSNTQHQTHRSQAAMSKKKSQLGLPDSAILSEISTLTERLRLELNIERAAHIAAEDAKTSIEADLVKAHQKICELETANRDLKEDLEAFEAERLYTKDLRSRHKYLDKNHSNLKEKISTLESRSTELSSEVRRLEGELLNMKEEQDSKQPIYQVGLDIRNRFTEQARETILYVKYNSLDSQIVGIGNAAAHGGRGEADMMILLGNRIPKKKSHTHTAIFKELYRHEPSVYKTLPRMLKEAIDCEATIRTLKPLNVGMSRPLVERQQALENVEILCAKFPKLSGADFDKDVDVKRRLDLIKSLTKNIVEWDRKIDGKRAKDIKRPGMFNYCHHHKLGMLLISNDCRHFILKY